MPRFFVPSALAAEQSLALPSSAARHVQVLRLQPGQEITLFNGEGGQWQARITHMGRSDVQVQLLQWQAAEREPQRKVHLGLGMPANERMDWLVEKATELGAASLWPLQTAHSVLRLSGERAQKKRQHWQAVATAACEQCGGNRLPEVGPISDLPHWLASAPKAPLRCLLSLDAKAQPLHRVLAQAGPQAEVLFLSGPEGGLSPAEEAQAQAAGFIPVSLGARVLRAETAALTALSLAVLGLSD
ncbi:MAG: 16S rRNA (uracil(1498)-N(3))-methyltransferase [Betaproteobacteria bacterium]